MACRDEYTEDGQFFRTESGLTEVPTDIPSGAKNVTLDWNNITTIRKNAFSEFSECTWLSVHGNDLNEIEAGAFSGLINLHKLELTVNVLKEIRPDMWMGLMSLKELSLGLNDLEDLPPGAFVGLPNVVKLCLAMNYLEQIRGDMFEGLVALEDLYLLGNDIKTLEPGAFMNLQHLKALFLGWNHLETLEMKAFMDPTSPNKHPPEMILSLSGNPMKCDENLCWLKEAQRNNWIDVDGPLSIGPPLSCPDFPGDPYLRDVNLDCTN